MFEILYECEIVVLRCQYYYVVHASLRLPHVCGKLYVYKTLADLLQILKLNFRRTLFIML